MGRGQTTDGTDTQDYCKNTMNLYRTEGLSDLTRVLKRLYIS